MLKSLLSLTFLTIMIRYKWYYNLIGNREYKQAVCIGCKNISLRIVITITEVIVISPFVQQAALLATDSGGEKDPQRDAFALQVAVQPAFSRDLMLPIFAGLLPETGSSRWDRNYERLISLAMFHSIRWNAAGEPSKESNGLAMEG